MSGPDTPQEPYASGAAQGQPSYGQYPPPGSPPPGYPSSGYPSSGYPPPGYPPPGSPPPGSPPSGYGQYPPPPYGRPQIDRHIGWFVVSWVFLWPLALYSLLSAFLNIDRALAVGNIAGAQYQAARVRKHGIIALCVGLAWLVLVFALFVAVGTTARSGSTQVCFGPNNC